MSSISSPCSPNNLFLWPRSETRLDEVIDREPRIVAERAPVELVVQWRQLAVPQHVRQHDPPFEGMGLPLRLCLYPPNAELLIGEMPRHAEEAIPPASHVANRAGRR